MKPINELSDDDIDILLLRLFRDEPLWPIVTSTESLREWSYQNLLRMRSKNHPDKWPQANLAAYQSAVEELDRRRQTGEPSPPIC